MSYFPPIDNHYEMGDGMDYYPHNQCNDGCEMFDEVYVVNRSADGCSTDGCGNDVCGSSNCCGSPKSIGIDQEPCIDEYGWKVSLDVSGYQPEEISVTAENNKITVEARKEMRCGYSRLSNGFTRKYDLPEEFNPDDVCVCFSSDCILVIAAPKIRNRRYPIQECGPMRYFVACSKDSKGGSETGKKPEDKKENQK